MPPKISLLSGFLDVSATKLARWLWLAATPPPSVTLCHSRAAEHAEHSSSKMDGELEMPFLISIHKLQMQAQPGSR